MVFVAFIVLLQSSFCMWVLYLFAMVFCYNCDKEMAMLVTAAAAAAVAAVALIPHTHPRINGINK